jgi:ribonuclease BN (tRNA processing enzyme)
VTTAGPDAVVITHDHPDHVVDLHGLFRARSYGAPRSAPRISLYAPEAVLERVAGLEDTDRSVAERVFVWPPLPGGAYDVGPFQLKSWALPHYVPNAGVRLSTPGFHVGLHRGYRPRPGVAELGRDADLYIVDATDRWQQASIPPRTSGPSMNLTSREPGEAAAEAGARRLLLTHFLAGQRPEQFAGRGRGDVPRRDLDRRRGPGHRPALTTSHALLSPGRGAHGVAAASRFHAKAKARGPHHGLALLCRLGLPIGLGTPRTAR